ncbi:hypothetical protein B0H14DRAFT_2691143 [Mycena olivaceomarginata]|nr:hypothetical protein B0H14DRAFT_2691143 [Mycena olivaceomarginata]
MRSSESPLGPSLLTPFHFYPCITLFFCCLRPPVEDDPTVIPTETTHLISPGTGLSSPGVPETSAVDHQKYQDRMGTIVRSKEGKMVNVSARAPFILRSASGGSASTPPASLPSAGISSSSPPTPTASVAPPPIAPSISRRPPVLTMTPAVVRLYADSRYSSPTGSRSSSRRRTDSSDKYVAYGNSSAERRKQSGPIPSEWLSETESESSLTAQHIPEEPENGVAIASPISISGGNDDTDTDPKAMSIAFSWGDV